MPREKDPVWSFFSCTKTKNTGLWARCKKCDKEMQGILNRMKSHVKVCQPQVHIAEPDPQPSLPSTSSSSVQSQSHLTGQNTGKTIEASEETGSSRKQLSTQSKILCLKNSEVITTTKEYKQKIDMQVGKYFYATNTPFNHVEHEEFKKLCALLRPGYRPPSAYEIGNPILEKNYAETMTICKEKLTNQTVCMSQDGWSNVHTEPLVCSNIVTAQGDSIFVDCADTKENPHTALNLKDIALKSIAKAKQELGVTVRSFVTDSAANERLLRSHLEKTEDVDIIQYGCSAHILNLLAKDLEIPAVTASIMKVIKYFRNHHIPAALYKQAGGKKLVLPLEVRWNTMNDAIRSYLDNRGILVQVSQDHKDKIDREVIKIVNDCQITMNAVDFLKTLSPIATALDRMQRNTTTIAIAVEIWNKLEFDLLGNSAYQNAKTKKIFLSRRAMALQGLHYAANMVDHRFLGRNLNNEQKKQAYNFITAGEVDENFAPFIMALTAKAYPFPKFMFGETFKNTCPILWWTSVTLEDEERWPQKEKFVKFCEQLLTAIASTAPLERCFSSFGLVQSKLRNRLGNEKAAKLVFLFKYYNQEDKTKKQDLSWILEEQISSTEAVATTMPMEIESPSDEDIPLASLVK
ncbi:uncharacterized protein LOC125226609 [Leguminivora glycinivorella]|uniref:uncharacterized protein LOC125226609 n=1 Tax=Leguminivora glycinivorella TaxID=1035111 RepID=UPI00200E2179|nr:uncharacterized protein LOC125226609 [Leguminivora glycinivorella]